MSFKKLLKKVMEKACLKALWAKLDDMTLDQLEVETVMAGFKEDLAKDEKAQQGMGFANLSDDDIRDVVQRIVPKLRIEKERRLARR